MTDELTGWKSKTVHFGAVFAGAGIEKALQNRPIHQYWDAFLLKAVSVKRLRNLRRSNLGPMFIFSFLRYE